MISYIHLREIRSNLLDVNSHIVSVIQNHLRLSEDPNSGSGTSLSSMSIRGRRNHDETSSLQSRSGGEVCNSLWNVEDHIPYISKDDKGIHLVFVSWTTLPLWIDFISKLWGSGMAFGDTRTGPIGAEESRPDVSPEIQGIDLLSSTIEMRRIARFVHSHRCQKYIQEYNRRHLPL